MDLKNILDIFKNDKSEFYYKKEQEAFDLSRDKDHIIMVMKNMF